MFRCRYFVRCKQTIFHVHYQQYKNIFYKETRLNAMERLEKKKVLLRERKRHTDRGVSSTPSVLRTTYVVGKNGRRNIQT